MIEKKFRVVRCPSCLYFQVTGASKSLKCLKCNKSKVLSYLKIYFYSGSAKECQLVLAELKKQEYETRENNHGDFFSYDNSKNSLSSNFEDKVASSEEIDDLLSLDFK
mgnify:CR=1 FL=1